MNQHEWLTYKNWAVVGASTKVESYGNKIIKRLLNAGYHTTPIAVSHDEVEGIKAYKSLLEVEGEIDVVNFVVNPEIGLKVLDEVIAKGIKRLLLQPGTASEALIAKAEAEGIEVLQSCVLVLLAWQ